MPFGKIVGFFTKTVISSVFKGEYLCYTYKKQKMKGFEHMKTNRRKYLAVFILLFSVLAIVALTGGCSGEKPTPDKISTDQAEILGEGKKSFDFTVKDADGNEKAYVIKTNAETVGEALLELGLIEGEEGPYGLYVKSVCGKRYDYDEDGKYWAFFIDGEYAMTGADATEIEDGKIYSFQSVEG